MSKYAVLGNPVSHSKSPLIHSLFAEQTDQAMNYLAIPLEENEFEGFVRNFFAGGGGGLNVTVPFKENAFALAASCSPRAQLAQAVNTLFLDDEGNICGDNTDGIGLVTDLKVNNKVTISGQRVLILGAGGAVRGIMAALVHEHAAAITIVNRTVSKAELLVQEMQSLAPLEAMSYEMLQEAADNGRSYDLIINGSSSSLQGEMPRLDVRLIAPGCCCYDLMYSATDTPFVQWAKQQGANLSIDGLGMLVEQAAEAFALWRGVRPNTAPVMALLREQS
ncbi:MAG: shikimate dehydrogenase [SAR86 cluster bacterium]|uniref:Shikimate dehydrogenase (NADP(+)) n=1 Tax=SAR86 cluster bacterium TaxID=2030880 RepID=A0A2A4WY29_9GAMM|nr:MAG: shikimate dehydrogenase [SAR86 cluster bacterium]